MLVLLLDDENLMLDKDMRLILRIKSCKKYKVLLETITEEITKPTNDKSV